MAIFQATAANGTTKPLDMSQFVASIVNADGESYAAQPDKLLPVEGVYGIAPGAAGGQVALQVPTDFVPAKIVLLPANRKHEAFRIAVGANDYQVADAVALKVRAASSEPAPVSASMTPDFSRRGGRSLAVHVPSPGTSRRRIRAMRADRRPGLC